MRNLLVGFALLVISVSCNKRHTCTCVLDETGKIFEVHNLQEDEADALQSCSEEDNREGISCELD